MQQRPGRFLLCAQQASQQPSPRQLSRPSLTATAAMTSAASRIGPPPSGERVGEQADQQRDGEVGAERCLARLLDGRGRVQLVPDPALGGRRAVASSGP